MPVNEIKKRKLHFSWQTEGNFTSLDVTLQKHKILVPSYGGKTTIKKIFIQSYLGKSGVRGNQWISWHQRAVGRKRSLVPNKRAFPWFTEVFVFFFCFLPLELMNIVSCDVRKKKWLVCGQAEADKIPWFDEDLSFPFFPSLPQKTLFMEYISWWCCTYLVSMKFNSFVF